MRPAQSILSGVTRHLPLALVALRLALAPTVVLIAIFHPNGTAFGTCLVLAFLSDWFDGVIARRLGVVTEFLRRADSIVDTIFYLGVAAAIAITVPDVLTRHWPGLVLLLVVEVARYVYDGRKFGKEAAYHMWSSKLWGILLFAGAFSALALGTGSALVAAAIYWGVVADLEGLAISAVLPRWQADVPTFWHARRIARAPR